MSDPEQIYLAPKCCAEPGEGRSLCEDDVWECEDGQQPTCYVRADIVADLQTKLAAAEDDAARYRWLESHQESWSWRPSRYNETIVSGFSAVGTDYLGFGFAAAIDAARGDV